MTNPWRAAIGSLLLLAFSALFSGTGVEPVGPRVVFAAPTALVGDRRYRGQR